VSICHSTVRWKLPTSSRSCTRTGDVQRGGSLAKKEPCSLLALVIHSAWLRIYKGHFRIRPSQSKTLQSTGELSELPCSSPSETIGTVKVKTRFLFCFSNYQNKINQINQRRLLITSGLGRRSYGAACTVRTSPLLCFSFALNAQCTVS
jgi:hypothetical protein